MRGKPQGKFIKGLRNSYQSIYANQSLTSARRMYAFMFQDMDDSNFNPEIEPATLMRASFSKGNFTATELIHIPMGRSLSELIDMVKS